ncbi:baeRF11 domain-containing protein [Nocardia thailandica]
MGDGEARAALSEEFDDLLDDPEFWRYQSRTLVVLATPARARIYRLPNRLPASTTVADRFLLTPLLRTVTFPQTAYVLALSEGAARLVEVAADGPAVDITPADLPTSAADHAGKSSLGDRAPKGRVQGYEGRKMRVRQYARAVDQELRPLLTGRDTPLVLAAAEPTDALFRSVNSYPDLLDESLPGNPEHLSAEELAAHTRPLLDRHYAAQLAELSDLFGKRGAEGRALTDVADVARAATFGIVDTVFVDIDVSLPGTLADDDGAGHLRHRRRGTRRPGRDRAAGAAHRQAGARGPRRGGARRRPGGRDPALPDVAAGSGGHGVHSDRRRRTPRTGRRCSITRRDREDRWFTGVRTRQHRRRAGGRRSRGRPRARRRGSGRVRVW